MATFYLIQGRAGRSRLLLERAFELATAPLTWRACSPALVTRIGPNNAARAANKASNGNPFVYDELLARMRAVLRRSNGPTMANAGTNCFGPGMMGLTNRPHRLMEESVRLEPLCRMSMHYISASWHRPYGSLGGDGEGRGFGHGDGVVSGEIEGKLLWANYPRRRQDGVWAPNLRGMITLRDGEELLVSIHGQSVQERVSGYRRAILARIELTTEAEPYRWLNTCFLVGEGEIDEEHEDWWLDAYVCVNEQAQGPPAIGAEPPERFRQRSGSGAARSDA